jgi:hypothetical protein
MVFSSVISGCRDKGVGERISGGSCEYQSYNGVLTIEEVLHDESRFEKTGYRVTYNFEAKNPEVTERIKRENNTIDDLTKEQILKGDIKPGKQFRTNVKYIVSGACAPGPYLEDFENWR